MSITDILPNGKPFEHWQDETKYTRILHVKAGAQDGDGSESKPFGTIGQAADATAPGTKVIIHGGLYRETVRPIIGGSGADGMICYEGAEGEEAVITGSEIYRGEYTVSDGWKRSQFLDHSNAFADPNTKVYEMRLPRNVFDGSNPFGMTNGGLTPWFYRDFAKLFHTKELKQQKTVVLKRGMIFCDGKRLQPVANYYEVGGIPGSFYVEDDGIHIHIRLFDDSNPADHEIEFTAREQCFVPDQKFLGYIKLRNLTFEKAGTGFPPPQRGAVSTECGHNWIIENCTVRQVNGVGMDVGFQAPARMSDAPRGHMTVTGCLFDNCGFSGLVGTCGQSETIDYIEQRQDGLYIADNEFRDCNWHPNEDSMEAAALKIHHTRDSLILRNRFYDTHYGCGMWMDASHVNLGIKGNIMLRTKCSREGALTVECSRDDIEVSDNIIIGVTTDSEDRGGWGLMTIACEQVRASRNVFLGCQRFCVWFDASGASRYTDGKGCNGLDNDLYDNVFSDGECAIMQRKLENAAEGNIYGTFTENGYIRVKDADIYTTFPYWQSRLRKDTNGLKTDFTYKVADDDKRVTFSMSGKDDFVLSLTGDPAEATEALRNWIRA